MNFDESQFDDVCEQYGCEDFCYYREEYDMMCEYEEQIDGSAPCKNCWIYRWCNFREKYDWSEHWLENSRGYRYVTQHLKICDYNHKLKRETQ